MLMQSRHDVLVTVPGVVRENAFHFVLPAGRFGKVENVPFILDTGSFELTLNQGIAHRLQLPNLGPLVIKGVSGSANAYRSQLGIKLGSQLFRNVRCIVDPSLTTDSLFGFRFLAARDIALLIDTAQPSLTFLR